jgi:hypothetical protein
MSNSEAFDMVLLPRIVAVQLVMHTSIIAVQLRFSIYFRFSKLMVTSLL